MLLNEQQTAIFLGMSISWVQRTRWEGGGPPYVKINHAVRYRQSDLEQWVENRLQNSTSDNKGGCDGF